MYVLCPYCQGPEVQITGEGQFAMSHPVNGAEFGWNIAMNCTKCDMEFAARIENTHLAGGVRRVTLLSVANF